MTRHIIAAALLVGSGCTLKSQSLGGDDTDDAAETTDDPETTDGPGDDPPAATLAWSASLDDVRGWRVTVATDGSIYVAGYSDHTWQGDGAIAANLWLGKFSSDGALLWDETIPNDEDDVLAVGDIAATSDGGFVLLTHHYGPGYGGTMTRYDAQGEPSWSTVVEVQGAATLAIGPNDTIVVGGVQVDETDINVYVGLAIAFDGDGDTLWSRTYGDPQSEIAAVHVDPVTGDILFGGSLGVPSAGDAAHAWLHLADATGTQIWEQTLGDGNDVDVIFGVDRTADGDIVALGRTGGTPWIGGFDPLGAQTWTMPALSGYTASTVPIASDGSFAFVGASDRTPDGQCWNDVPVDPFLDCAPALAVGRSEAEGTPRWALVEPACTTGVDVALTLDERVLVLTDCPTAPQTVSMNLRLYVDP